MLSQEEIRIRAGLDYSKVTAGLTDIRGQVFKLAKDVPKALSGILKANVFGAVASLASELIPTWQEIWNGVYGTDELTMKRREESYRNIQSIRKALRDAKKDLQGAQEKYEYDSASPSEKLKILEDRKRMVDAEVAQEEKKQELIKSQLEDARILNGYEKSSITQEKLDTLFNSRMQSETALTNLKIKQLEVDKMIAGIWKENAKVVKGLTPEQASSQFSKVLDESKSEVYKSRMVLRSAAAALEQNPNDPEAIRVRDYELGNISKITKMRAISGIGEVINAMPDNPMLAGIKESLAVAQEAAMKNVIQRVSIVEIKE